ncbi:SRPBCC family protein [Actinoplanes sp. N902-109]|uniref:SRPBCC family protein n=1 Tax=Actinoplanes sp. (strain N902-109) TaxID=649831 RepID=UPI0007C5101B|nr:SRPBCC family protein [Actinoplanes sp. N902-109]
MPAQDFAITFEVAAAPAAVYAHLSDPQSYIGLSPLVVAVREVHTEPGRVRYTAIERFPIGPLHWDNPLRVVMTFPEPGQRLVSDVHSPGWVHLVAATDLVAIPTGTRVTESVHVTYPWLLGSFVLGQARSVQRKRAAELTRRMSGTSSAPAGTAPPS